MRTSTGADYQELAKLAAGNWKKFDSFCWHDRHDRDDADQWCIVYTNNRDSTLLDQSNAECIDKIMDKYTEGDNPDVVSESHNHWAVGHVDGYSIRVFDASGNITPAFIEWCDIQQSLADYPVLNEDHYSELESNATGENVQEQVKSMCRKHDLDYTDELCGNVYNWISDNKPNALESRDDQGGYPDDDDVEEALTALGLLVEIED